MAEFAIAQSLVSLEATAVSLHVRYIVIGSQVMKSLLLVASDASVTRPHLLLPTGNTYLRGLEGNIIVLCASHHWYM